MGTGADAGSRVITSGTGTCSITATKAADDNYNVASSAPATTVTVNKAAQLLNFDLSSLSKTYGDSSFSISDYATVVVQGMI
jgi:hypothetical protein